MIKLADILDESKNPHQYQVKGMLVTNTQKRKQGDILSDKIGSAHV